MICLLAQSAPAANDPLGGWLSIVSNASGWALLVAVLLAFISTLMKGMFVVGKMYQEKCTECDFLRSTSEKQRERLDLMERSLHDIAEGQKTVVHVVESLPTERARRDRS